MEVGLRRRSVSPRLWQPRVMALDHTSSSDAVAEMNSYSALRNIGSRGGADLREFRAGDSVYFTQALARTDRHQLMERCGKMVLLGMPRETF